MHLRQASHAGPEGRQKPADFAPSAARQHAQHFGIIGNSMTRAKRRAIALISPGFQDRMPHKRAGQPDRLKIWRLERQQGQ